MALHRETGPGLLEMVYEVALAHGLQTRGLRERKSVEAITEAPQKQVLTHLRLTGFTLGYLRNFGESLTKDGISRIVNGEVI